MECARNNILQPRYAAWLAIGLLGGCSERPTAPSDRIGPEFATVVVTDPTTILFLDGVNVKRNVTIRGTVAGIVVMVDKATVDLSQAVVDCSYQTTSQEKIGVWIQGNRTGVHVTGQGTGMVRLCDIGLLIGPLDPNSQQPGGFKNHVDSLLIQNTVGGELGGQCFYVGCAIAVSNSHDNVLRNNTILQASDGGIVVSGGDHRALASGRNRITGNTILGGGDFGIVVSSDSNMVSGNEVRGWLSNIVVDQDGNFIAGNQVGYFNGSAGLNALWLKNGADDNIVTENEELVLFGEHSGDVYFFVEAGAHRNVIRGNIATSAIALDAFDQSGDCANNKWIDNTFSRKEPACIR